MESPVSSEPNHAEGKEQVSPKTLERIQEIISTLPEGNFFRPLRLYKGYWVSPSLLEGVIFAEEHFRAKPEDIFLCSALKTGTTWLKAMCLAIVTRTHLCNSENPLLSKVPHDCVPFLEVDFIENYPIVRKSDLPLLSTHVPYSCLPKFIIDAGCKIVYICRDPKDVFVSLWHFMKKLKRNNGEAISLVEAFELFCKGCSSYGPYWDHVIGYWKASLEFPDRILLIKYEEMMEDTKFWLKRLATFMGYPFSLEEENEGVVQKIIDLCAFENLSNLEVNKKGKFRPKGLLEVNNSVFFRKGKVGDWKNYLTSEMGERLDKIMEQNLRGSGLKF